jgi:hypothetical protein
MIEIEVHMMAEPLKMCEISISMSFKMIVVTSHQYLSEV